MSAPSWFANINLSPERGPAATVIGSRSTSQGIPGFTQCFIIIANHQLTVYKMDVEHSEDCYILPIKKKCRDCELNYYRTQMKLTRGCQPNIKTRSKIKKLKYMIDICHKCSGKSITNYCIDCKRKYARASSAANRKKKQGK